MTPVVVTCAVTLASNQKCYPPRQVTVPVTVTWTQVLYEAANLTLCKAVLVCEQELPLNATLEQSQAVQNYLSLAARSDGGGSGSPPVPPPPLAVHFELHDNLKVCTRLGCQNLLVKKASRRACALCKRVGHSVSPGKLRLVNFNPEPSPISLVKSEVDEDTRHMIDTLRACLQHVEYWKFAIDDVGNTPNSHNTNNGNGGSSGSSTNGAGRHDMDDGGSDGDNDDDDESENNLANSESSAYYLLFASEEDALSVQAHVAATMMQDQHPIHESPEAAAKFKQIQELAASFVAGKRARVSKSWSSKSRTGRKQQQQYAARAQLEAEQARQLLSLQQVTDLNACQHLYSYVDPSLCYNLRMKSHFWKLEISTPTIHHPEHGTSTGGAVIRMCRKVGTTSAVQLRQTKNSASSRKEKTTPTSGGAVAKSKKLNGSSSTKKKSSPVTGTAAPRRNSASESANHGPPATGSASATPSYAAHAPPQLNMSHPFYSTPTPTPGNGAELYPDQLNKKRKTQTEPYHDAYQQQQQQQAPQAPFQHQLQQPTANGYHTGNATNGYETSSYPAAAAPMFETQTWNGSGSAQPYPSPYAVVPTSQVASTYPGPGHGNGMGHANGASGAHDMTPYGQPSNGVSNGLSNGVHPHIHPHMSPPISPSASSHGAPFSQNHGMFDFPMNSHSHSPSPVHALTTLPTFTDTYQQHYHLNNPQQPPPQPPHPTIIHDAAPYQPQQPPPPQPQPQPQVTHMPQPQPQQHPYSSQPISAPVPFATDPHPHATSTGMYHGGQTYHPAQQQQQHHATPAHPPYSAALQAQAPAPAPVASDSVVHVSDTAYHQMRTQGVTATLNVHGASASTSSSSSSVNSPYPSDPHHLYRPGDAHHSSSSSRVTTPLSHNSPDSSSMSPMSHHHQLQHQSQSQSQSQAQTTSQGGISRQNVILVYRDAMQFQQDLQKGLYAQPGGGGGDDYNSGSSPDSDNSRDGSDGGSGGRRGGGGGGGGGYSRKRPFDSGSGYPPHHMLASGIVGPTIAPGGPTSQLPRVASSRKQSMDLVSSSGASPSLHVHDEYESKHGDSRETSQTDFSTSSEHDTPTPSPPADRVHIHIQDNPTDDVGMDAGLARALQQQERAHAQAQSSPRDQHESFHDSLSQDPKVRHRHLRSKVAGDGHNGGGVGSTIKTLVVAPAPSTGPLPWYDLSSLYWGTQIQHSWPFLLLCLGMGIASLVILSLNLAGSSHVPLLTSSFDSAAASVIQAQVVAQSSLIVSSMLQSSPILSAYLIKISPPLLPITAASYDNFVPQQYNMTASTTFPEFISQKCYESVNTARVVGDWIMATNQLDSGFAYNQILESNAPGSAIPSLAPVSSSTTSPRDSTSYPAAGPLNSVLMTTCDGLNSEVGRFYLKSVLCYNGQIQGILNSISNQANWCLRPPSAFTVSVCRDSLWNVQLNNFTNIAFLTATLSATAQQPLSNYEKQVMDPLLAGLDLKQQATTLNMACTHFDVSRNASSVIAALSTRSYSLNNGALTFLFIGAFGLFLLFVLPVVLLLRAITSICSKPTTHAQAAAAAPPTTASGAPTTNNNNTAAANIIANRDANKPAIEMQPIKSSTISKPILVSP